MTNSFNQPNKQTSVHPRTIRWFLPRKLEKALKKKSTKKRSDTTSWSSIHERSAVNKERKEPFRGLKWDLKLTFIGNEWAEKRRIILLPETISGGNLETSLEIRSEMAKTSPWFSGHRSMTDHFIWFNFDVDGWFWSIEARELKEDPVVEHEYWGYWEKATTLSIPSLEWKQNRKAQ